MIDTTASVTPARDDLVATAASIKAVMLEDTAAAAIEPSPDPLAGFAVDANELIGRIHAGQGHDVSSLVARTLAERAA